MDMLPTRREAILATLSSLLMSSCCGTMDPPTLDASIPRRFIDVHCHVFDAHDIPVKPFLIDTALKEEVIKQPWIALGKLLADATEIWSAMGDPERDSLNNRFAVLALPSPDQEKARFQLALEQAIQKSLAAGHAVRGGNRFQELLAPSDHVAGAVSPQFFALETEQGTYSLNWEAASIFKLLDDFHIGRRSDRRVQDLMKGKSAEAFTLKEVVSDDEAHQLSQALTSEADTGDTDYGGVLYVASLLMRTRNGNIEQLDKSLGVAGATPTIVRLYVPALVDFDCWYGDAVTSPSLDIATQCAVMAKLAKQQSDPNRFVNGYVAFDPLRALLAEAGILQGEAPLQTVRTAIETQGFAGVKLYPPMGFAPIGNDPDNKTYGDAIQGWIKKLAKHYNKPNYQIGPELDRVLKGLYRYCLQGDVPIMAHCGNSQASVAHAGARATPKGWDTLLSQQEFKMLRLNLAHFGSFWCHDVATQPVVDPSDPGYSNDARCAVAWDWTDQIVTMITKTDGNGPAYPNLYCDVADMSEIATNPQAAKSLGDFLDRYTAAQKAVLANRLLYGTDWFFLALAGKEHVQYIPKVEVFLQNHGVPAINAFHENTARFLGLTKDGNTAARLQQFYGDDINRKNAFLTFLGS